MNKADKRWRRPGITIGRYGDEHALVRYRVALLDVDLYDMPPTKKLLDALGCLGKYQLQLPQSKFIYIFCGLTYVSVFIKNSKWASAWKTNDVD